MQEVYRGEVAPEVGCGHREGHSNAWPAIRMRGRGLRATLLIRFQGRVPALDARAALVGTPPRTRLGPAVGTLCVGFP